MNAPPVGVGDTSSQGSVNYVDYSSKDKLQEETNDVIPQGNPIQKGVILAKDSLDVPLEVAFGISNEKSERGKPTLMPLIRTRYVDTKPAETPTNHYQELRSLYSPNIQAKLLEDESQLYPEDRDPDMIALNQSLKFAASILDLSGQFTLANDQSEGMKVETQFYANLPQAVKNEVLKHSEEINNKLKDYLQKQGANDPAHDIFLNAAHQIDQAIEGLA